VYRSKLAARRALPLAVGLGVVALIIINGVVGKGLSASSHSSLSASDLAAFCVLCAVATYAVIETAKRLLPVRQWVLFGFTEWRRAESRMLTAALGPETLNAPVEVVVAQIASALEDPTNPLIPEALAGFAPELVQAWRADGPNSAARSQLDRIQINLGARWRRAVHTSSFVIAAAVASAGALSLHVNSDDVLRLITLGTIVGAPGSWTVRDLTAIVERFRRG
jgi:hypothetical protein